MSHTLGVWIIIYIVAESNFRCDMRYTDTQTHTHDTHTHTHTFKEDALVNFVIPWRQVIFDGGNTAPNVGPTLLTSLWCPEVGVLAALCPQVSWLQWIHVGVGPCFDFQIKQQQQQQQQQQQKQPIVLMIQVNVFFKEQVYAVLSLLIAVWSLEISVWLTSLNRVIGMATAPSTPVDSMTSGLDADSTCATRGGSPVPTLPSPALKRQCAQVFDSPDQQDIPTERYPSDSAAPTTGISTAAGLSDHDVEDGQSEGSDNSPTSDSKDLAVFLGDNSDSDSEQDPKERLATRKGWLHQEWRDLKSHNESYGEGCENWDRFMKSGLKDHGYSFVDGMWIKTGPTTKKHVAKASSAKKPVKKPRTPMKVVKAMKSTKVMKVSPKKASVSPMKAMKAVTGKGSGRSGSSKDKSPVTPKTRKIPKTPRTPMKVSRKSRDLDSMSPPVKKSLKTKSPKSRSMSSNVQKAKWECCFSIEPGQHIWCYV